MTSPLLTIATALLRGWTRMYTAGLPASFKAARRAEIESDLWEFESDTGAHRGRDPGIDVLLRWVRGVHADVWWRLEEGRAHHTALRSAFALAIVALVVAAVWMAAALQRTEPPRPPAPGPLQWRQPITAGPPPPPPPPPPCAQWNPTTGCSK